MKATEGKTGGVLFRRVLIISLVLVLLLLGAFVASERLAVREKRFHSGSVAEGEASYGVQWNIFRGWTIFGEVKYKGVETNFEIKEDRLNLWENSKPVEPSRRKEALRIVKEKLENELKYEEEVYAIHHDKDSKEMAEWLRFALRVLERSLGS